MANTVLAQHCAVKTGQHLAKLQARVQWLPFMTHKIQLCASVKTNNLHAQTSTIHMLFADL